MQKSFDQLEPGGWFEAQDLLSSVMCDDDTMSPDYPLKVHFEDIEDATASEGRPLRSGDKWRKACEDVGFVDVTEYVFKIPINGWPRELRWKELGKMWEANFLHGIQAVTYGPLGRIRKLTRTQMEVGASSDRLDEYGTTDARHRCYWWTLGNPYQTPVSTPTRGSSSSLGASHTPMRYRHRRWMPMRILRWQNHDWPCGAINEVHGRPNSDSWHEAMRSFGGGWCPRRNLGLGGSKGHAFLACDIPLYHHLQPRCVLYSVLNSNSLARGLIKPFCADIDNSRTR